MNDLLLELLSVNDISLNNILKSTNEVQIHTKGHVLEIVEHRVATTGEMM